MGSGSDEINKFIANELKRMGDKIDARDNKLTTTVDKLVVSVQDIASRLAKLEALALAPDPDAADSSAPPPHQDATGPPDGSPKPLLAGKSILDSDGKLQHGHGLLPKKPFDEVLNLKTASSSGGPAEGIVPRYFRLDFPRFDGKEDPLPWLSRCEQFFRAQRTEPMHKIWLATFHLDGDAFHWYVHLERSCGTPSWEDFHELCNVRFGPSIRNNPLGELRLLRQTGTVAEYQSRFLALLSRADVLSDRQEQ
jgi:hypothetical protein